MLIYSWNLRLATSTTDNYDPPQIILKLGTPSAIYEMMVKKIRNEHEIKPHSSVWTKGFTNLVFILHPPSPQL